MFWGLFKKNEMKTVEVVSITESDNFRKCKYFNVIYKNNGYLCEYTNFRLSKNILKVIDKESFDNSLHMELKYRISGDFKFKSDLDWEETKTIILN